MPRLVGLFIENLSAGISADIVNKLGGKGQRMDSSFFTFSFILRCFLVILFPIGAFFYHVTLFFLKEGSAEGNRHSFCHGWVGWVD